MTLRSSRRSFKSELKSELKSLFYLYTDTVTGCISPDSLLGGRRRIVSARLRASNDVSGNRASQARLSDDGWCSGQLGTNIFTPYIEVDFSRNLIFTSVATQGLPVFIGTDRHIERYRVEVAGEDGDRQYIIPSTNSSQPQPAVSSYNEVIVYINYHLCVYIQIFPLGQSRISNTNRHTESLPRPVIGQVLRINPYEWNDEDHVCTKLEVYGCPLLGMHACSASACDFSYCQI